MERRKGKTGSWACARVRARTKEEDASVGGRGKRPEKKGLVSATNPKTPLVSVCPMAAKEKGRHRLQLWGGLYAQAVQQWCTRIDSNRCHSTLPLTSNPTAVALNIKKKLVVKPATPIGAPHQERTTTAHARTPVHTRTRPPQARTQQPSASPTA